MGCRAQRIDPFASLLRRIKLVISPTPMMTTTATTMAMVVVMVVIVVVAVVPSAHPLVPLTPPRRPTILGPGTIVSRVPAAAASTAVTPSPSPPMPSRPRPTRVAVHARIALAASGAAPVRGAVAVPSPPL